MSNIARVSAAGQTTIPEEICAALAVKAGDLIEWEVTGDGRAEVRRKAADDPSFAAALSGTLDEWESPEDDEAYRDL